MIIAIAIIIYAIGIGAAARVVVAKCPHGKRCDGLVDHPETVFLAGFWPVSAPAAIGYFIAGWMADANAREARRERKHQRKMEILEAEAKLNRAAARIVEDYQP